MDSNKSQQGENTSLKITPLNPQVIPPTYNLQEAWEKFPFQIQNIIQCRLKPGYRMTNKQIAKEVNTHESYVCNVLQYEEVKEYLRNYRIINHPYEVSEVMDAITRDALIPLNTKGKELWCKVNGFLSNQTTNNIQLNTGDNQTNNQGVFIEITPVRVKDEKEEEVIDVESSVSTYKD